ncbi:PD-(D/E)XK nuclease family protein [Aureitalea marina]|uniref:PD-(D/E)XK endonuclease-like domain-containing protein n=1 Tax=Aureitalea marina TaxID=930804 RepID=A0A2S7KNB9_9FLAO|nr:PD-(D/E)XK nuclease family protein [Aureitalea marina]PQB04125.1 hypothetical protein BST85_03815 [Aureitalea marina]
MRDEVIEIAKFGPSKIHFISECELRYFNLLNLGDGVKKNKKFKFNKNSFLGIVVHSVIEEYINEQFDLDKFDKIWSKIFKQKLRACDMENKEGFVTYFLPYYIVKKNKTKKLIETLKYKLDSVESEVEIESSLIKGTVDMLELNASGKSLTLTDFKSGPIWDYIDGKIDKVKAAYEVQLKSYGLVFWEKGYDADKITCVIQGLSNKEYAQFRFEDHDYESHKKFLHKLKNHFNLQISSNQTDILGTPGDNTCDFCEFISSCKPLHNDLLHGDGFYRSILIIDQINSEFDDQNSKINISTNGGLQSLHKIPETEYWNIKSLITKNEKVLVSNLYHVVSTRVKNWTQFSTYSIIKLDS